MARSTLARKLRSMCTGRCLRLGHLSPRRRRTSRNSRGFASGSARIWEFDEAREWRESLQFVMSFREADQKLLSVKAESVARGGELAGFARADVVAARQ